MHAVRLLGSMAMAFGITIFLFWCMNKLISNSPGLNRNADNLGAIQFGPIEIEEVTNVNDRRKPPEKPKPPERQPQPPKLVPTEVDQPVSPIPDLDLPNLDIPVGGGGGVFTGVHRSGPAEDGDVVPLVRIAPIYPQRAQVAKIEGYVTVRFTITETGSVTNPRVIDAQPQRIFNKAAIKAILKWKFKPRVIDGQPVSREATQTLDFELADV